MHSRDEARIANACFLLAAIIAGGATFMWAVTTPQGFTVRLIACFVSFGLVGWLSVEAVRYVGRQYRIKVEDKVVPESATPTPAPTATTSQVEANGRTCHLNFESQIVARLYSGRDKAPPPGAEAEAKFKFKELFYEWRVTITPESVVPEVSITVDRLKSDDRIHMTPDDASKSDLIPKWASGFNEPARKPDHYARNFKFTNLSKERTATIAVRRPVNELAINGWSLGEPHIIRVVDAVAASCRVEAASLEMEKEVQRLNQQLTALTNWNGGSEPPLPIKSDAGITLAFGELQSTIEARCNNEDCTQLTLGQLEVSYGGAKSEGVKPKKAR